jgi:nucleoside-diphosphate-sugar epimerase
MPVSRLKRILVTGHHGYLGSVMAPWLAHRGYDVAGLDVDYFGECTIAPGTDGIPSIVKDLRDVTVADLEGFDAVVHLAALSNDPIGNLNSEWTRDINLAGSVRLAEHARTAGVQRFLFSSSCIMYGLSDAPVVDETSPLDPQTDYARSKVLAEREIGALATDSFSPTFLRNGTVYGLSPRMRFDTVLNDLMGAAVAERRILVHGDGTPWRPVVHVEDVARAFAAVLDAPADVVHNQAFNTGADMLNIQVGDLARTVAEVVPGCRLEMLGSPSADRRSYRASFAKFARTFPAVRFRTPAQGARDLYAVLAALPLTERLYRDPRFIRLKWLRQLLENGELTPASLRRSAVVATAR